MLTQRLIEEDLSPDQIWEMLRLDPKLTIKVHTKAGAFNLGWVERYTPWHSTEVQTDVVEASGWGKWGDGRVSCVFKTPQEFVDWVERRDREMAEQRAAEVAGWHGT